MKTIVAVAIGLAASLLGCGQGGSSQCGQIAAGFAVNCSAAAFDMNLAESMIIDRGLATETEVQDVVADTSFYARRDLNWVEGDNGTVYGKAEIIGGRYYITLNRRGGALLHEMLHALNWKRGVSTAENQAHTGWSTNGFYQADDDFGKAYWPWGPLVMLP